MRISSIVVACITTIASTASGAAPTQRWLAEYDGVENDLDSGNAVAIAADGSTYVAGSTVVPGSNGSLRSHALLLKYDAAGALEWDRIPTNSTPSISSSATHVAVAPDGSIVVAMATNSSSNYGVAKFDPAGNELWWDTYEADSFFVTGPSDLKVDAQGNIYITGDIGRFQNGEDITLAPLLKYAPDGARLWLNEYAGPEFTGAGGEALAIDNNGYVYLAGWVMVNGSAGQFSVTQFSPAGAAQWTHSDGYVGSFCYDLARAISIDPNGDIVATGFFGSNTAAGPDIATVKLTPGGAESWKKMYDGPFASGPSGYSEDGGRSVVIDSSGNATIAAHTQVALGDYDIYLASYDPAGMLRWEDTIAGDGGHNDWSRAMTVDQQDNVYVAGQYVRPSFEYHAFVARYSSAGAQEFLLLHEDHNLSLGAESIAAGPGGTFAITADTFTGNRNIITILYGPLIGDLNNDGAVDVFDLFDLLGAWGDCSGCQEDINGDGAVDVFDLFELLANWG